MKKGGMPLGQYGIELSISDDVDYCQRHATCRTRFLEQNLGRVSASARAYVNSAQQNEDVLLYLRYPYQVIGSCIPKLAS
jgi:hypothetical protein